MAIQLSEDVRNARLDAIEATIGAAAILKIRTGSPPVDCAADDSGDVLATIELPSDWMDDASGGSVAKKGTWEVEAATDSGTAGHFRIYASDGETCHIQGTITQTGNGGDMELDNTSIAVGQKVTITSFTLTDGNV